MLTFSGTQLPPHFLPRTPLSGLEHGVVGPSSQTRTPAQPSGQRKPTHWVSFEAAFLILTNILVNIILTNRRKYAALSAYEALLC